MWLQAIGYLLTGLALTILAVSLTVIFACFAYALSRSLSAIMEWFRQRFHRANGRYAKSHNGKMSVLLTLILVTGIPVTLFADSKVVLTITDSGFFETTVDSTGVPQSAKIVKILDLRTGGNTPTDTPPPTVPDVTPPEVDASVVIAVEEIAKAANDPVAAQGLARVYKHINGAVKDKTLDMAKIWPAIKTGTNEAVKVGNGTDWTEARAKLGALITDKERTIATIAQMNKLLFSIQHGLERAADGSAALSDQQMAKIYTATQGAINASR